MRSSSTPQGERDNRNRAMREAIHALYAARHVCAVEEFASYFAPDARWTVVGNPVLSPGAGMRLGRAGIGRFLQTLHETAAYLGYTIHDIVIDGDLVVVRWTVEVRFLVNGRTGSFEVLDHMRIKDGLIVELTHYCDTGSIAIARGGIKIA